MFEIVCKNKGLKSFQSNNDQNTFSIYLCVNKLVLLPNSEKSSAIYKIIVMQSYEPITMLKFFGLIQSFYNSSNQIMVKLLSSISKVLYQ